MRMWKRALLGASLTCIAAVALVACSSESPTATPVPTPTPQPTPTQGPTVGPTAVPSTALTPVTREEKDLSGNINLKVGQELNVSLASNPSTGFRWDLADPQPNSAIIQKVKNEYKPPERQIPGAGGTDVWTFRGVAKGQATVNLKYFRSFDPPTTAPAKQVSFAVVVE